MRKALLLLFLTLSCRTFAELYENPQNFRFTVDGVTYMSYSMCVGYNNSSGKEVYDYFVRPVSADPNITSLVIPPKIDVDPEVDTVDKINHTYQVFDFDGNFFNDCKQIKSISISMYGYPGYNCDVYYVYSPSFSFFGTFFPPETVETLDINMGIGHNGDVRHYTSVDNVLYVNFYDSDDVWSKNIFYIPGGKKFKEFTVEEDITHITASFEHTGVEKVFVASKKLISIGTDIFKGCDNLKEVWIYNSLVGESNSNIYGCMANVPLTATVVAPRSEHEKIREYWKGENLYAYPIEPEFVDAKAEYGNVSFQLKTHPSIQVDSIKLVDHVHSETMKPSAIPCTDGVYAMDCSPLTEWVQLYMYYTRDGESFNRYEQIAHTREQLQVSDASAEYGNVKVRLTLPTGAELDSIYGYGSMIHDPEMTKWIKKDEMSVKGNEYSFRSSPILKGTQTFRVVYSAKYKGYKPHASESFSVEQTNVATLGDKIINLTSRDYRNLLDRNYIDATFEPDFSKISGKVDDYGYTVLIEDRYDYGFRELDCKSVQVSAKDKELVTIGPLIDTDYIVTPYVNIAGQKWAGNSTVVDVPRFGINPVEVMNEPGRIVLSVGLDYNLDCDTISSEWVVDGDTIIVENDTTLTLTSNIGEKFRKNITYVRVDYKMLTIFGSYTDWDSWIAYGSNNLIVETPDLMWTTLPAVGSSDAKAVIAAEVNVSQIEEGSGFEWRRCDAPELVPSTKVACPVVGGVMSGRLSNLSANTYYQYRPYYESADGTMYYGEWIAFGTADTYVYFQPMVNTYEPQEVTETSATLNGYALGGSDDIIEQGFEYYAGSRSAGKVLVEGERMTATLTDLAPATEYTVRAFAKDAKTTTYGAEVVFTTAGEPQDAIEEVESAVEQSTFDVWTLQGVRVKRGVSDLSGLRPGLYIVNGRKVLVR